MEDHFIYHDLRIHYTQFGTGDKAIIAFHGFGQTSLVFEPIAEALGENFTIYSFDLPFHGKTIWKEEEQALEKKAWKEIIKGFIIEKNLDSFSIIGFSIGGKFALVTLELFPEKIEKLILIAPDGIKANFWYSLATYPYVSRAYFKSLIHQPGLFFKAISIMSKISLMDKTILKFVALQMNTVQKRKQVYFSWIVFRDLKFDLKKIGHLINNHGIDVSLYLGEFDRLITVAQMRRFLGYLETCNLRILKTGHNSLLVKVAEDLKKDLDKAE